jgi:diguanylate cyclase
VAGDETRFGQHSIRLSVSVGFAVIEATDSLAFEKLREIAAGALLEAKQTGRNRCVVRKVITGA